MKTHSFCFILIRAFCPPFPHPGQPCSSRRSPFPDPGEVMLKVIRHLDSSPGGPHRWSKKRPLWKDRSVGSFLKRAVLLTSVALSSSPRSKTYNLGRINLSVCRGKEASRRKARARDSSYCGWCLSSHNNKLFGQIAVSLGNK